VSRTPNSIAHPNSLQEESDEKNSFISGESLFLAGFPVPSFFREMLPVTTENQEASMTMTEMIQKYWLLKGQRSTIRMDGLTIQVKVIDLRRVWNRVDALITPIAGEGETWVDASRLK
jgi:hypothetical protein